MSAPAYDPNALRLLVIKIGLEAEMQGARLTLKSPPCFTMIRREFGIKVTKGDKRAAYVTFCERFGFEVKS